MSTPAITFLKKKGAPFKVVRYEHAEKGAAFAAQATGFALERTIKTLVVEIGGGFALALMPGNRELDLKALAVAAGAKKAAMADAADAQRLTGYLVGGISPFGVKKAMPAVMDAGLMAHPTVMINAGRRGMLVEMAPDAIARALGCKIAPIAQAG